MLPFWDGNGREGGYAFLNIVVVLTLSGEILERSFDGTVLVISATSEK